MTMPEYKAKAIKVYDDMAYGEKMYTEYEAGKIHFVNHAAEKVFPSVFGRAGDGFNVIFIKKINGEW